MSENRRGLFSIVFRILDYLLFNFGQSEGLIFDMTKVTAHTESKTQYNSEPIPYIVNIRTTQFISVDPRAREEHEAREERRPAAGGSEADCSGRCHPQAGHGPAARRPLGTRPLPNAAVIHCLRGTTVTHN